MALGIKPGAPVPHFQQKSVPGRGGDSRQMRYGGDAAIDSGFGPNAGFEGWSGGRDSNPRQSAWKAGTLPTELPPHTGLVGVRGLEPPTSASQTPRATRLRHTPLLPTARASIGSPSWARQTRYLQRTTRNANHRRRSFHPVRTQPPAPRPPFAPAPRSPRQRHTTPPDSVATRSSALRRPQ